MTVSDTPTDLLNALVRTPPLAARGASWSSEVTESGAPYWCLIIPVGGSGLHVETFIITEDAPTFYATDTRTDATYAGPSFRAALAAVMVAIGGSSLARTVLDLAPVLAAWGQLNLQSNTKLNL